MTGKRIWHLISNRWFSAITQYCLNGAIALDKRGYASLVTPLKGSPAEASAASMGLHVRPVGSFRVDALLQLRYICRHFSPDVIIVYGGPEMLLSRMMPGFGSEGKPVLRFRGHALTQINLNRPALFRFAHSHVAMVIAPGERLSGFMRAALGGKIPVRSVPIGIDTEIFCRPREVSLGNRPELLLFGRFDPVKGHERFLRIFSLLLSHWKSTGAEGLPAPMLTIAGQPANLSHTDLKEVIRSAGLIFDQDVRVVTGRLSQVNHLMAEASVGVVSSLASEEICRVAQEMLLCGTPLFLSGVGALEEVLFMNAGVCYRNKSDSEAAGLLYNLTRSSFQEGGDARELRASMAKGHFSLQAMGRRLSACIAELTSW